MLVQNAGGQLMGIVMNNVDISGDTQYQYYTTYYSYYTKGDNRKEPAAIDRKAKTAVASTVEKSTTSEEDLY